MFFLKVLCVQVSEIILVIKNVMCEAFHVYDCNIDCVYLLRKILQFFTKTKASGGKSGVSGENTDFASLSASGRSFRQCNCL